MKCQLGWRYELLRHPQIEDLACIPPKLWKICALKVVWCRATSNLWMLPRWYKQGGQVCVLKTATRVWGFSEKKLRFSLFWRWCQYVFQWGWGQGIQILNSFCLVSARFCLFLVRRVKDDDIWYFSVLWNDVRSKGQDSTFSRKFGFSFLGLFNKWTWAKVG